MKLTSAIPFLPLLIFSLLSCKHVNKKIAINKTDTCNSHDTSFYIHFTKDTSTTSFYKLLTFIESKGAFSRYNKNHKVDSSTGNEIVLQKLLCLNNYDNPPIENWILENVFSKRCYLASTKPVKGEKDYFPKFDLIQLNFATEAEKEKAYNKIKEIGWGDPLKKWNDYYIATGKTKIYILQSYAAIFSETTKAYRDTIQAWVDKNISVLRL